jgi:hypothetical protein
VDYRLGGGDEHLIGEVCWLGQDGAKFVDIVAGPNCVFNEVPTGKAVGTGEQNFQKENLAPFRRRSASSIIAKSSFRLAFGAQPSLALALAGLMLLQQGDHKGPVSNVSPHKNVAWVVG